MQKLTTFGIIFAFTFGMAFVFVGGVHAEGSFPANPQAEEPLEERERGVIIDSGGWMKVSDNNPLIDKDKEELDFILFSEEFPAESGGWMKIVDDFPGNPPKEEAPGLSLRKKLK